MLAGRRGEGHLELVQLLIEGVILWVLPIGLQ